MAKTKAKAKTLAEMTCAELADYHAENLVAKRNTVKELTEQLEAHEAYLRNFYVEQGIQPGTVINGVQFTERFNPAKLVGATGKAMELKQSQLIARLADDYKTTKLNVGLIASVWESDATVRALVKDLGLEVEQNYSVSLKVVDQPSPSK